MMKFTGFEYLLIDAANNFGLDKLRFEDRIQWARDNLDHLEDLLDQAETKPLYLKAVMAIRKAQNREPTGHLVAMDATCSGVQIMSVLTGCMAGAKATGLVDPDRRADAYSDLNECMNGLLGGGFSVPRKDTKQALMTSCYGSKKVPKVLFGEGTEELNAFYEAVEIVAPGAWELLQDLLASWQAYSLCHAWKLPDGFDAKVKVMVKQEARIEVDELDHATFTYEYYVNEGEKTGRANVANVIHSIDAFILRELLRRCNYDFNVVSYANDLIETELLERNLNGWNHPQTDSDIEYFSAQFMRSGQASVVILPYLNEHNVSSLGTWHLQVLKGITNQMLQYNPFPVITIHDSFAAHANNVNWVRHWYKEILAELADSEVLSDILSQIHGVAGNVPKRMQNLSALIRQSNYALS